MTYEEEDVDDSSIEYEEKDYNSVIECPGYYRNPRQLSSEISTKLKNARCLIKYFKRSVVKNGVLQEKIKIHHQKEI